jgi:hypothetical protein
MEEVSILDTCTDLPAAPRVEEYNRSPAETWGQRLRDVLDGVDAERTSAGTWGEVWNRHVRPLLNAQVRRRIRNATAFITSSQDLSRVAQIASAWYAAQAEAFAHIISTRCTANACIARRAQESCEAAREAGLPGLLPKADYNPIALAWVDVINKVSLGEIGDKVMTKHGRAPRLGETLDVKEPLSDGTTAIFSLTTLPDGRVKPRFRRVGGWVSARRTPKRILLVVRAPERRRRSRETAGGPRRATRTASRSGTGGGDPPSSDAGDPPGGSADGNGKQHEGAPLRPRDVERPRRQGDLVHAGLYPERVLARLADTIGGAS